jgi:1-pyrroline-5-carboxylate dehydrogenase
MLKLPEFRNEPYLDFTQPQNRRAMQQAMEKVRGELGREYDLLIAGDRVKTGNLLKSVNPSKPSQLVGAHHKATPELARRAVEDASSYFAEWGTSDPEERVQTLVRAAGILRERKLEFNAWLAFEAGKTWPEAEAETAEAIDFCEFYAR